MAPEAVSVDEEDARLTRVIEIFVDEWSKTPHEAPWEGELYLWFDWTTVSLVVERALGISAAHAAKLGRRAIGRMKMERNWDSEAAGWDLDDDFPDWTTMAVSLRRSLLWSAKRSYSSKLA